LPLLLPLVMRLSKVEECLFKFEAGLDLWIRGLDVELRLHFWILHRGVGHDVCISRWSAIATIALVAEKGDILCLAQKFEG